MRVSHPASKVDHQESTGELISSENPWYAFMGGHYEHGERVPFSAKPAFLWLLRMLSIVGFWVGIAVVVFWATPRDKGAAIGLLGVLLFTAGPFLAAAIINAAQAAYDLLRAGSRVLPNKNKTALG